MVSDLRILEWNANGLLQHQHELQVILETQHIDVCLISETHFTNQMYIKFNGYHIYHALHPQNTARGGAAVIIKQNIIHYERQSYETEEIQAASVSIRTKKFEITVASMYSPPRHIIDRNAYSFFFNTLGEKFIVGGDFNAKHTHWGSRLTTKKGKELYQAIIKLDAKWHSTGKPTYWPTDINKVPDLLDFFVSRKLAVSHVHIEEEHGLSSDHSPILLTLSEYVITKGSNPTLTNKKTDWESFKMEIHERIKLNVPIKSIQQLELESKKFIIDVQQAAWNNTPEIRRRTAGINYPKEIRDLIKEKRRARKEWQKSRTRENKTVLNNLTQQLKREIQEIKNESINKYLRELTDDQNSDYSLWKAAKRLNRPIKSIPPIREESGIWARTNKQKAALFATYLQNIFQPNEKQAECPQTETTQKSLEIKLVTPKEVIKEIKENINSKKAPGYDLITGEILKQLPKKGVIKITHLINASFRLKYVPMLWKTADVIMIPKPGKTVNEAKSYRPISLLPVLSKLFEKLFHTRLKKIIDERQMVPDHQFGFRNKHSTVDQVHRITEIIEDCLEKKEICSAVFLDVAQAFDKVWHDGLIKKLKVLFPLQYTKLLESYLSQRTFRIKQENEYSELKIINAGVPQGSVLGPVLYLLYTCDIPVTDNIKLATFADDTAVLAVGNSIEETTANLQYAVNAINAWTAQWRIKLNENKSVHMNFTNRKVNHLSVQLNNNIIPRKQTTKYLGLNLDVKLKWKVHVKMKTEQLKLKYKSMYWLLGRDSQLSIKNKLLVYQQVLKPVWTYGLPLWGCTKPSNYNCLQVFQNRVLRNIVNAPWYVRNEDLHRELQVRTVKEEIAIAARRHEERLHNHPNVEALQLLDNQNTVRRLKRTKPFELVNL